MTDDQIINIAWETFPISDKKRNENFIALLVHFARKIEAVEREECAKMCDYVYDNIVTDENIKDMSFKIRARGQE
jgi:hypothetical protein